MKLSLLVCNPLVFLLFGCNPQGVYQPPPLSTYIAVEGKDTAWLKLSIGKESFKGQGIIKNYNSYTDSGDVKGIIKGDTLLGDFHYLHYGVKWKRRAIALLRKDQQLIMGEGKQQVFLDIPFFDVDSVLDYDSVKFVFKQINKPQ